MAEMFPQLTSFSYAFIGVDMGDSAALEIGTLLQSNTTLRELFLGGKDLFDKIELTRPRKSKNWRERTFSDRFVIERKQVDERGSLALY